MGFLALQLETRRQRRRVFSLFSESGRRIRHPFFPRSVEAGV